MPSMTEYAVEIKNNALWDTRIHTLLGPPVSVTYLSTPPEPRITLSLFVQTREGAGDPVDVHVKSLLLPILNGLTVSPITRITDINYTQEHIYM